MAGGNRRLAVVPEFAAIWMQRFLESEADAGPELSLTPEMALHLKTQRSIGSLTLVQMKKIAIHIDRIITEYIEKYKLPHPVEFETISTDPDKLRRFHRPSCSDRKTYWLSYIEQIFYSDKACSVPITETDVLWKVMSEFDTLWNTCVATATTVIPAAANPNNMSRMNNAVNGYFNNPFHAATSPNSNGYSRKRSANEAQLSSPAAVATQGSLLPPTAIHQSTSHYPQTQAVTGVYGQVTTMSPYQQVQYPYASMPQQYSNVYHQHPQSPAGGLPYNPNGHLLYTAMPNPYAYPSNSIQPANQYVPAGATITPVMQQQPISTAPSTTGASTGTPAVAAHPSNIIGTNPSITTVPGGELDASTLQPSITHTDKTNATSMNDIMTPSEPSATMSPSNPNNSESTTNPSISDDKKTNDATKTEDGTTDETAGKSGECFDLIQNPSGLPKENQPSKLALILEEKKKKAVKIKLEPGLTAAPSYSQLQSNSFQGFNNPNSLMIPSFSIETDPFMSNVFTNTVNPNPFFNTNEGTTSSVTGGEDYYEVNPKTPLEERVVPMLRQMGFTDMKEILSGIRSVLNSDPSAASYSDEVLAETTMVEIVREREEADEALKMDEMRIQSEEFLRQVEQTKESPLEAIKRSSVEEILGFPRPQKQDTIESHSSPASSSSHIIKKSTYFPSSVILESEKVFNMFHQLLSPRSGSTTSPTHADEPLDVDNEEDTNSTIARNDIVHILSLEKKAFGWYGSKIPFAYFQYELRKRLEKLSDEGMKEDDKNDDSDMNTDTVGDSQTEVSNENKSDPSCPKSCGEDDSGEKDCKEDDTIKDPDEDIGSNVTSCDDNKTANDDTVNKEGDMKPPCKRNNDKESILQSIRNESSLLEKGMYMLSEQEEAGLGLVPKIFLAARNDATNKSLVNKNEEIIILEEDD